MLKETYNNNRFEININIIIIIKIVFFVFFYFVRTARTIINKNYSNKYLTVDVSFLLLFML